MDVVYDVAPTLVSLVDYGVVQLHHVAIGSFVGVSVLGRFLHPALWETVVL